MIKSLDNIVSTNDYYGAILEVEARETPLLTPSHTSRAISRTHFDWLTGKLCLFPSTIVRTGLYTEDKSGRLILPVPLYPDGKCYFTDAQGWQSESPKPVLWAPQARTSGAREWEIVRDYFCSLCAQKGLSEQVGSDILTVAGLTDHYNALTTGDLELHFDIWDCLAAAQAREAQLMARCFDLQHHVLSAASPTRIDSLFRTYDPLNPLLFACAPAAESNVDPQQVVFMLQETIDLSGRKVVLTVPFARACDLTYWQTSCQLSHALESAGASLRMRLLPQSLALTTTRGVPVPVSPQLLVSRFGGTTYFDLPLRAITSRKESLSPQELWEQQETDRRGSATLFELLTEEVLDLA
jgi:hypothetical protein